MTRLLLCILLACTVVSVAHADSYSYPTAIIGFSVESTKETHALHKLVAKFGAPHGLKPHTPPPDPRRDDLLSQVRRRGGEVFYLDPRTGAVYGFGIHVLEYSPQCMLISLFEQSPALTRESLDAFSSLHQQLFAESAGRA